MSDLIERQAAIDALDEYFERIGKLKRRGLNKGEKAISLDTVGAIKSLPSAQPEPCEDAVSRKAVIDAIDEWKEACADNGHKGTVSDIKLIRKDFIELPPVTPKQRTGKWKYHWNDEQSVSGYVCSECGWLYDEEENFCPNCGADMRGEWDG